MFRLLFITSLVLLANIAIMSTAASVEHSSSNTRTLIGLAQFIYHYTQRNPLDYIAYGCWCGPGNRGTRVMDAIDGCCKIHDGCYKGWTSSASYYLVSSDMKCLNKPSSKTYKACLCDKEVGECFARNKYNPAMIGNCREQDT